MRRNLWFGLLGLIMAAGFVIVAMPRTAELADAGDNPVSTTTQAPAVTTVAPATTTTTALSLDSLTPEELVAFREFIDPTTTITTPPTTTTTKPYVPPTTVYYEPAPEPEPQVYEEPVYEPSGSGCVIPAYICQRESGNSYTALNPSSGAGGMYQFMPSTWNAIARAIAPEWISTPPHTAPPYVQDQFAIYLWDGGRGCYHWSAC